MSLGSFEYSKGIDSLTKDTVNGYLRRIQTLFPSDNVYYNTPDLVSHWCILYFYIREKFDPNHCYKSYTISHDDTKMTRITGDNGSIYLSRTAEYGTHEWEFKIIELKDDYWYTTIGIWKMTYDINPEHPVNNCSQSNKVYGWIINDKCLTMAPEAIAIGSHRSREYGERVYGTGDIITMKLDLNKKELSFSVNGKDLGVAFAGIDDTEYKAMVSMNGRGDQMEILSYSYST